MPKKILDGMTRIRTSLYLPEHYVILAKHSGLTRSEFIAKAIAYYINSEKFVTDLDDTKNKPAKKNKKERAT